MQRPELDSPKYVARQDTITRRTSPHCKHNLQVMFYGSDVEKSYKTFHFTEQERYHNSTNIHILRGRRHHPTSSFRPQFPCWLTTSSPSLQTTPATASSMEHTPGNKTPIPNLSPLSSSAPNYFPNKTHFIFLN